MPFKRSSTRSCILLHPPESDRIALVPTRSRAKPFHYLHCKPFALGGLIFIGLDFPMMTRADGFRDARKVVASLVKRRGPPRCVIVSHERLARTAEDMPGAKLLLYGHRHHFEDKTYRGSRFVNVSALGQIATVRPAHEGAMHESASSANSSAERRLTS